MRRAVASAGFTLVEVLVALFAMALLSVFAWQALDVVLGSREAGRVSVDRVSRLATVLAQWEQDLQGVEDSQVVPAIAFDGQTLRLTRRTEAGVVLVAWSVRSGAWQRWSAPPQTRAGALQDLWQRSFALLGNEPGHLKLADGASTWQIYFHRGNAWTNAQSTGDLVQAAAVPASGAAARARERPPGAVRLVITLDGRTLTRDVVLGQGGA